ncbi:hypothetical protein PJK45_07670 [Mycobacterium kansasii]|uniref:Uncharacterized protein n=3 Tax=Mycobacterium kansasii TaxID=1768 RepID=A0A1V3XRK2_MYCKA|nr:hypothetical protein [Mycobacterium kansasii]EUA03347.1 hypothetical protein I547_0656 [Mycobacterium kansasii 824]AGZ54404.1 hypothetical protein MKAN_22550 [Mycobacterium kansasii ATCC 12478]EUA20993.1 hypothetical protein I545_0672 [Mycobacterium kansasii 662]KEP43210.1 hypothetical protein MKSMC1_15970 [Mycobacterium kansasii]OOK81864.1 hypothetical protein BZL30_1127 [Mycobacterium kansasii]
MAGSVIDGAVEAVELDRLGFENACGAVGMTKEHPLQQLIRRLWACRDQKHWSEVVP